MRRRRGIYPVEAGTLPTSFVVPALAWIGCTAIMTGFCLVAAEGTISGYLVLLSLLAVPAALLGRMRGMARPSLSCTGILLGLGVGLAIMSDLALADRIWTGAVIGSWVMGLAGGSMVLVPLPRRRGGTVRTTLLAVAALLWLTSPVWTGPAFASRGIDWSPGVSALHPLFVTNATAAGAGIWSQQPVAYVMTPLGQGVDYALPHRIWPFISLHLAMFGAGLAVRRVR